MKDVIYMNINTYGKDERLKFCREYIYRQSVDFSSDIVLLPIPATKDGIMINGTDDKFSEICSKMNPGDAVIGYGIPREIREIFSSAGLLSVDVSLDEEFLQYNAKLTAEGTLAHILSEHKKAPCDMKIGIIGYGRIGKYLLNCLLFLGADVIVFTSKSETRLDLCSLGVSAVSTACGNFPGLQEAFRGLDILINTAPAKIISEGDVPLLKSTRVIELASGDNMPKDLYYERFRAVPAMMYPESAGFALGAAVIRMLGLGCGSEKEMTL